MKDPIDPRPLSPPEYPDETIAMENWVAGFLPNAEQINEALEAYAKQPGCCAVYEAVALLCSVPAKTDLAAKHVENVRAVVNEIVTEYANEVLWPAHLEVIKRGDYL